MRVRGCRGRVAAAGLAYLSLAGLVGANASAAPARTPTAPELVIVDTDIGDDVDDAFALAIALADRRLKVVGVTTAWGDTRRRVLLARRLIAASEGSGVIVGQGPPTSDRAPFTQAKWAEGEADLTAAPDAIAVIRAQVHAHPGQITLVALAPLSNVEALMRQDPQAVRQLKRIVVMGGSIHAGYARDGAIPNPVPSAEYNIASEPSALTALLASGVPVILFPLDSTQLKFDEVRRDRLFAYGSPVSDALTLLYHQWRLANAWGQLTPTLFDAIPVLWLIDPTLCPTTPMRITVDAQGYTRPAAGSPNTEVCLSLHEEAAQKLIFDDLAPVRTPSAETR